MSDGPEKKMHPLANAALLIGAVIASWAAVGGIVGVGYWVVTGDNPLD